MARLHYANYLNNNNGSVLRRIYTYSITDWRVSAYSLIIISFFLILFSSRSHGDEFTGLPHDDPKNLTTPPPPMDESPCAPPTISAPTFAPLPDWAHGANLGALPYQLTPMGKKPARVVAAGAKAEPLAPPKEDTTPAVLIPMPASSAASKPAAPEPPALIAVSPFLQWVKSNPQAAAAQARQQATSENPPQTPAATTGPAAANQPVPATTSPYWLPPLIDSGEFGASPGGSSAAIYTTPQR